MPRISDRILECVIYLYPSVDDANEGTNAGGSGFLVSVLSNVNVGSGYIYAVTNSHVIREGDSPIIRMNTKEGSHDVLPLNNHSWYHHPSGDDIAVCPIGGLISSETHKYKHIQTELFLTEKIISDEDIGGGDEVFMVGRFISHEGKQRNIPTLRFGNIAMMPLEPIMNTRKHMQESFLIETRSLPGYSGSPVFVHILPFSKRPGKEGWSMEKGPWLLGIDWGHIPLYEKVVEKNRDEYGNDVAVTEGWRVKTNTGMAGVIPAWKLNELLNIEEFVMKREEADKEEDRKRGNQPQ